MHMLRVKSWSQAYLAARQGHIGLIEIVYPVAFNLNNHLADVIQCIALASDRVVIESTYSELNQ